MIAELARRLSVPAFTEHQSKVVSGEEAPAVGVDGVLVKSKDVDVVPCGNDQVADSQDATRVDDLYHAFTPSITITLQRRYPG